MERLEAYRRIDAAVAILEEHGWTDGEVEALGDGLSREDAVAAYERQARKALGLEDWEVTRG